MEIKMVVCFISVLLGRLAFKSIVLEWIITAFVELYLESILSVIFNHLHTWFPELTIEIVMNYIKNRALRVFRVLKKLFIWFVTSIKNLLDK